MTANDRFKRQNRAVRWAAATAAIGLHIAILLLTPAFRVDFGKVGASGPRLVVTLRQWQAPPCVPRCQAGFVAYDTMLTQPRLTNGPQLNQRIPKIYPPLMWVHREPSNGTFQVEVGRSGKVRNAALLQSSENGGDEALITLVRLMRFEPLELRGSRVAVVTQFEVAIETPF